MEVNKAKILKKLGAIWAVGVANPYMMAIAGVIIFVLAWYFYIWYVNQPSENELNIQRLNNEAVEIAPETGTAKGETVPARREAERTAEVANRKTKEAEAARNANTTNTNYNDANAARCRAYPESPECSK